MVKFLRIVALSSFVLPAVPASAQSPASTAQACIAELAKLDRNADGFVENTDMTEYGPVATNVDLDNDNRLSADERRIACDSGLLKPLKVEGVTG